jgi:beta-lactamase regulating signal transducer with metallopeptidase domain
MDWQHIVQSLVFALAESCWIAAFSWILLQVILALFPLSPNQVYILAASAYGLIFFSWVYALGMHLFQPSSPWLFPLDGAVPLFDITGNALVIDILALGYVTGMLIKIFRYVQAWLPIRAMGKQKQSLPAEWETLIKNLQQALQLTRSIQIGSIRSTTTPLTFGWLQPIILLPVAAINQLSMAEARAIILHELAHIRRNDYLHECLLSWMNVLLFCNPFAQQLLHIIRTEREKACDDMVLQQNTNRIDYVTALGWCAQHTHWVQAALGASGKDSQLLIRIKRIAAQPENGNRIKPISLLAALLILLGGLFLSNQANDIPTQLTSQQPQPIASSVVATRLLPTTRVSVIKNSNTSTPKKITSPKLKAVNPKMDASLSASSLTNTPVIYLQEIMEASDIIALPVANISTDIKKLVQLMKLRILSLPIEERRRIVAASIARLTIDERREMEQGLHNFLLNSVQPEINNANVEESDLNQAPLQQSLPTLVHPKITLKLFEIIWNEINQSPNFTHIHLLNSTESDSTRVSNKKMLKPNFE